MPVQVKKKSKIGKRIARQGSSLEIGLGPGGSMITKRVGSKIKETLARLNTKENARSSLEIKRLLKEINKKEARRQFKSSALKIKK